MVNRWEWLISNATLEVVDFNIHFRGDDFREKNRIFPFYVMSYVKEGRAEATFQNQVFQHLPGTLLIIPPGVRHAHCVPEGAPNTMFLWWHFNLTIGGVLDIMRLIAPPNLLHVKNTKVFEDVFVQYVELYGQNKTIPNIIMKRAKGLEVMAYLLENILSAVPDQNLLLPGIPDSFFEMLMLLTEHPERNLSLNELSERYYMNPTYISNRFKKLFGLAPHQTAARPSDRARQVPSVRRGQGGLVHRVGTGVPGRVQLHPLFHQARGRLAHAVQGFLALIPILNIVSSLRRIFSPLKVGFP